MLKANDRIRVKSTGRTGTVVLEQEGEIGLIGVGMDDGIMAAIDPNTVEVITDGHNSL